MFPVMKNAYLQHVMTVPPRIINRMVDEAMNRATLAEDLEPPFLPPPCQTPYLFALESNPTRARIAFLHWAIPKLIRELHSKDIVTRRRALASLSDILRDPEKAFTAIKLDIIPRLADLLVHTESYIRERSCFILGVLGNHSQGGKRVLTSPSIAANIQACLDDDHPMVQAQAANTIEIISRTPWVCDGMLNLGFPQAVIEKLKDISLEAPCVMLLEALHNMVSRNPEQACELEVLDLMLYFVEQETDDERILGQCCRIIGQLAVCERGHNEADEKDILSVVVPLLFDERPKVHTHAAKAFQAITISTRSRWRCREFQKLPSRLTQMATYRRNITCQIYSMQCLQNICALPVTRESALDNCIETIKNIQTSHSKLLTRVKERLLKNLTWLPYDITDTFDGLPKINANHCQKEANESSSTIVVTEDDSEETCPCQCTSQEDAFNPGFLLEIMNQDHEERMQNVIEPEPTSSCDAI